MLFLLYWKIKQGNLWRPGEFFGGRLTVHQTPLPVRQNPLTYYQSMLDAQTPRLVAWQDLLYIRSVAFKKSWRILMEGHGSWWSHTGRAGMGRTVWWALYKIGTWVGEFNSFVKSSKSNVRVLTVLSRLQKTKCNATNPQDTSNKNAYQTVKHAIKSTKHPLTPSNWKSEGS